MIDKPSSLVNDFQRFFTVDIARTPEQLQQVFHIRYRVYCEEFAYEPRENSPDEMERDSFDQYSTHCLITHKTSNMPAGCVRLVKSEPGSLLPMESFCGEAISPEYRQILETFRGESCEISRLAVDRNFRRRTGEHLTRFGQVESLDWSKREQRTFSLIAVAAYLSACALTSIADRPRIYAMMESFLPRLMGRSGIPFSRIGEDIDYHGMRAPYVTSTPDVVAGMLPDLRELYDSIHSKFSSID